MTFQKIPSFEKMDELGVVDQQIWGEHLYKVGHTRCKLAYDSTNRSEITPVVTPFRTDRGPPCNLGGQSSSLKTSSVFCRVHEVSSALFSRQRGVF